MKWSLYQITIKKKKKYCTTTKKFKNQMICSINLEKKPNDYESLFGLLHELGHIHYKTKIGIKEFEDGSWTIINLINGKHINKHFYKILLEEINAWIYVFQCTKKNIHKKLYKIALKHFKTYTKHKELRCGKIENFYIHSFNNVLKEIGVDYE